MRYLAAPGGDRATPATIVAPQLWNYVGSVGPLPVDYWHRLFAVKAGLDIRIQRNQPTQLSDGSAVMHYDCEGERGCVILLQYPGRKETEVITSSAWPRYFTVTGVRSEVVKVVPTLKRSSTLLEPAVYAASVPTSVDLARWQLIL
jgi:hypothetical protein